MARSVSTSPGRDASPSQVTSPQFVRFPHQFAGTHLYTWAERGTVRVKSLAQEHNTMSPARDRTWTTRSGVERTNHEATAPPTPYGLVRALFSYGKSSSSRFLLLGPAMSLVFLNSSLSPILYCWKISEVKQAVKEAIKEALCYLSC